MIDTILIIITLSLPVIMIGIATWQMSKDDQKPK